MSLVTFSQTLHVTEPTVVVTVSRRALLAVVVVTATEKTDADSLP